MKSKGLLIGVVFFSILFSTWLMSHTFSWNSEKDSFIIASKAWSDFGAHIPLIRSFSYGPNLDRLMHGVPPESPLFPGEPIRYHFLFYASVGILEKIGIPLHIALNGLSALGFTGLLICIFILSKMLFGRVSIALLTLLFFLFNGSLSFLKFFKKYPLSISTLRDIETSTQFASFGPWDGGLVTAFWNLNIYTNQRHLALSYAIVLLLIVIITQKRGHSQSWGKTISIGILSGICMGILLFLNQAAALIAFIWLSWFFLIIPHGRISLIIGSIITLPFIRALTALTLPSGNIVWHPGYLINGPLTVLSIFTFWVYNLGLYILLIPIGLILLPKKLKLLLIPPLLVTFILPNLFQFSPDMINNHKFLNFGMIFGAMISAYTLIFLFNKIKAISSHWIIGLLDYLLIGLFSIILILSGIIDFFPILNDHTISLVDAPKNNDVAFFRTIPPDSIVLNSTWFFHPATLAGRAIFSGYSYFTWSYGYDKEVHEEIALSLYRNTDKNASCQIMAENNISYIELSPHPEDFIKPNDVFLKSHFVPVYQNDVTGITVFDVKKSCGL